MQIVRMTGNHADSKVLSLPLDNPPVMAPVHHDVVQQVSLSILCTRSPATKHA